MFGRRRALQQQVDRLHRRNRELEGAVRELAARAGVGGDELERILSDADPGLNPEVRRLLDEGRHVSAIRAYREATGAGLREAKEAVDRYRDRP